MSMMTKMMMMREREREREREIYHIRCVLLRVQCVVVCCFSDEGDEWLVRELS